MGTGTIKNGVNNDTSQCAARRSQSVQSSSITSWENLCRQLLLVSKKELGRDGRPVDTYHEANGSGAC